MSAVAFSALEEREQPADEPILQVAHPRPPHRNRAIHQREVPRLAMPVARADRRVQRRPPRGRRPAQQRGHFVLQELLDEGLDVGAGERLERVPGWP